MYGGYYGGYGYYDDDWMMGMAIGTTMVIGAAAVASDDDDDSTTTTTTTTSTAPAALPCDPTVTTVQGVTYYQCGPQHYVQAYGSTGPIYMPVPPPGAVPAPATQ
jgi:hypothetical protein